MNTEKLIKNIVVDMLNVSKNANPKNFRTDGKITWKKFMDTKYGPNIDFEKLTEDEEIYDQNLDKIYSIEELKNMYNDPEELNFWVYDRFNDGSCIIYTIYGDENSKYGTYEITVDEILDI